LRRWRHRKTGAPRQLAARQPKGANSKSGKNNQAAKLELAKGTADLIEGCNFARGSTLQDGVETILIVPEGVSMLKTRSDFLGGDLISGTLTVLRIKPLLVLACAGWFASD
jgi:hypothetical protein